jgi:thymidylate kinase
MHVTTYIEVTPRNALAQIKEDLAQFELGPDFRDSVSQHYKHLERLSASLRKLGIDSETIDQHVVDIFDKYKTELLRNIERLKQP